jgi:shikimate dehydrogenase
MKYYSFGLIGFPLDHSLSPGLHRAALESAGLEGEYRCFPIHVTIDNRAPLLEIINRLRTGTLHGLNVTIPYKQVVMPYVDELTQEARIIGAVNTLYFKDGYIVGDNTDAVGFWEDLDHLGWFVEPRLDYRALVLGAGGAARAVVYVLIQHGWRITIAARRLEQARSFIGCNPQESSVFLGKESDVISITSLNRQSIEAVGTPNLIVNATPVGMTPHIQANPWPEGLPIPSMSAVYDLVYNPPVTALMAAAKQAGARTAGGGGMLIEQAARSFELWTGIQPSKDAMQQALSKSFTLTGM